MAKFPKGLGLLQRVTQYGLQLKGPDSGREGTQKQDLQQQRVSWCLTFPQVQSF